MFKWLRRSSASPVVAHGAPDQRSMVRAFVAAQATRLLDDWNLSAISIDKDVEGALVTLRTRSRDLCQNNDYGRRYLNLLVANVVGPAGIRLQMKVKNRTAKGAEVLDDNANRMIEAAWDRWGRREQCCTTRRHSFTELLALLMFSAPRDGEALVRVARGYGNEFGFALSPIAVDCLDHSYSDTRARVRMGVETDAWGAPVAYHVLTTNPADGAWPSASEYKRERIPAAELLHVYKPEHLVQTRGIPWTHTAMRRLHIAGKYEETALVAARVGAAHMGFFITGDGTGLSYGDDKDSAGNQISEVAPGKFETLGPTIKDFKQFAPQHPTTNYGDYVKAVLRGAASGLNISYISLANDLEGTSYSSGRQGLLEERSYYMHLQQWLIDWVCQPVFDAWLPMAIAAGQVNLPMADLARYRQAATWQPRRWTWIDPRADMEAAKSAVALGINSRSRIAGDQGADLDDVFDELAREQQAAERLGIEIDPDKKTEPAKETANADE